MNHKLQGREIQQKPYVRKILFILGFKYYILYMKPMHKIKWIMEINTGIKRLLTYLQPRITLELTWLDSGNLICDCRSVTQCTGSRSPILPLPQLGVLPRLLWSCYFNVVKVTVVLNSLVFKIYIYIYIYLTHNNSTTGNMCCHWS